MTGAFLNDPEILSLPDETAGGNLPISLARFVQQSHLDLISSVAETLSVSAPLTERLALIAEQIRGAFGVDACVIRGLQDDQLTLLTSVGLPEDMLYASLPAGIGIAAQIIATQTPVIIPDVANHPVTSALHQSGKGFVFRSYAGAPLLFEGRVLGILGLYTTRVLRHFTEEDETNLQAIARYAAVAIENDRLFQDQRRIADTLQQTLLPAASESVYGSLALHAHYSAASSEAEVGGDFYDWFPLDEHRIAFVVGDVAGKGLAAASFIAEVKFTLRVYLRESEGRPDEALTRLNRFLREAHVTEGERTPTVALLLGVANTATGELRLSSAGAEYPVLLRASGRTETLREGGPLMNAGITGLYPVTHRRLLPGDLLLLATDGVIEARRGNLMFATSGIANVARPLLTESLPTIGEAVVTASRRFAGDARRDDACLLLVRTTSA